MYVSKEIRQVLINIILTRIMCLLIFVSNFWVSVMSSSFYGVLFFFLYIIVDALSSLLTFCQVQVLV